LPRARAARVSEFAASDLRVLGTVRATREEEKTMTMHKAKIEPSGCIRVDGVGYRTHQAPDSDEFTVVTESTGEPVGTFVLESSTLGLPHIRVSEGAVHPEVVRAVAEALSGARGFLPLQ
jgi:hypothetical protein